MVQEAEGIPAEILVFPFRTMPQQIVYSEDRLEYVLDALDRGLDEEGYVVDDEGDRVPATDGDPIKAEDIGYIGHGSTEFVRDDISEITDYLHDSDS